MTHAVAGCGMTGHGGEERLSVDGEQYGVGDDADRRGARHITNEGDLAEPVAPLQLAPVGAVDRDHEGPADHGEVLHAGLSLHDDRGPGFGFDAARLAGNGLEGGAGKRAEQRSHAEGRHFRDRHARPPIDQYDARADARSESDEEHADRRGRPMRTEQVDCERYQRRADGEHRHLQRFDEREHVRAWCCVAHLEHRGAGIPAARGEAEGCLNRKREVLMTDEAEVSTPADDAMDAGLDMFLNLAAPQAGYGQVIEAGGCLQPVEGLTATFSRALTRARAAPSRTVLVGRRDRPREHPSADPAERRSAPSTRSTARSSTRCLRRSRWTRKRPTSPSASITSSMSS